MEGLKDILNNVSSLSMREMDISHIDVVLNNGSHNIPIRPSVLFMSDSVNIL